jgi:hypothetical protein
LFALQLAVYFSIAKNADEGTRMNTVSTVIIILCNTMIGAFELFFLINFVGEITGKTLTPWILDAMIVALYIYLVSICSKVPDLIMDDPNSPVVALPKRVSTAMAGLHFLLPVGGLGCRLDNLHPAHPTATFRVFPQTRPDWKIALRIR